MVLSQSQFSSWKYINICQCLWSHFCLSQLSGGAFYRKGQGSCQISQNAQGSPTGRNHSPWNVSSAEAWKPQTRGCGFVLSNYLPQMGRSDCICPKLKEWSCSTWESNVLILELNIFILVFICIQSLFIQWAFLSNCYAQGSVLSYFPIETAMSPVPSFIFRCLLVCTTMPAIEFHPGWSN